MDRGSITKWLFLALALVLFYTVGLPLLNGSSKTSRLQPWDGLVDYTAPPQAERTAEEVCTIDGDRFQAELSSKGGTLKHFFLKDPRFAADRPRDLVTTNDLSRMPLRTDLRAHRDGPQQVAYDDLDWKLEPGDGKSCTFTFTDPTTRLTKTIAPTGVPYELAVTLKVENLGSEPRVHRLTFEQTSQQKKSETEGGFGRRTSEHVTETLASTVEKTERQHPSDFEPGEFKKKEFTDEKWRRTPGEARYVAVSSSYFTEIAIPVEQKSPPNAETQIEFNWDAARYPTKDKDPEARFTYRARLAYPEVELAPHGAATYKIITYEGPKDRDLLAALHVNATEVLNLGTFAVIAKFLIAYLYKLHGLVGSWGWAIVLLTITVRTLLFPLSLTQIKSSAAMRKLKPEMDVINEKYKDDATQKSLAIQELWRKNNVTHPVLGCLPMLLQMPVWFALYTALQTAVELYHAPFGPVIPDLSAPGLYYIIPVVLGCSSFFQQRLMPPQGDPQQQKMMMYMMPGIFTVMMLFLPAGLGVYMLTNTWLGIGQQLLVERYLKKPAAGDIVVREKSQGDGSKPALPRGKGKARDRG